MTIHIYERGNEAFVRLSNKADFDQFCKEIGAFDEETFKKKTSKSFEDVKDKYFTLLNNKVKFLEEEENES